MSRFPILSTSSSFTSHTGDAKVKVTDAKSAKARMKRAKRDMENGWYNGRIVKQVR